MARKTLMAIIPFYGDVPRKNRGDLAAIRGLSLKQTRSPTFSFLDCSGVIAISPAPAARQRPCRSWPERIQRQRLQTFIEAGKASPLDQALRC
jgi:hypothetical protein